jgi:hypothetical protein
MFVKATAYSGPIPCCAPQDYISFGIPLAAFMTTFFILWLAEKIQAGRDGSF